MRDIDEVFPLKEYRPGQKQCIEAVLKAFETKKFVLLDAPTGSGKSAIGFTIAQYFDNSYMLTIQKMLQDQLTRDFGEKGRHIGKHRPMIDLKGRNAYECTYYKDKIASGDLKDGKLQKYLKYASSYIGCDEGECKKDGKSKLDECLGKCPYLKRVQKAKSSKICLMNFHSYLFQSVMAHQFGHRSLMILDEGHNIEDVLMSFIELRISDRYLVREGIQLPKFESVQEYLDYFEEIDLNSIICDKKLSAIANQDPRDFDEWVRVEARYNSLRGEDPDNWVCIWSENKTKTNRTVSIKPIFVDRHAQSYLFENADKVLIMSATLLSKKVICNSLGIDKDDAEYLVLPSTFPPEYRPIHFKPSGSMSYKNKSETIIKMADDVTDICRRYKDQKGIIHTHNFNIMQSLLERCPADVTSRFLVQTSHEFQNNKSLMLERHRSSKNSILIAPAMHEGVDLVDSDGRFSIICKVPYPSLGDPQIKARMEYSHQYYDWRTMCKLCQSYGRIHRHAKDIGVTFILDDDFERFISRNKKLAPRWFKDAFKFLV